MMHSLEYDSVEQVLEEVRAMRVRGGSAFGQAAATAFFHVAADEALESKAALFNRLDEVAEALLRLKPTMATIHNARALIVEAARASDDGADPASLRDEIRRRALHLLDHSRAAVQRLGAVGANLVQDGETIMMHSYSASVMAIFAAARAAGKEFRVICTESRPLREGRASASYLSSLGVPVTFVTDASMAEMAWRADWMLTGADSVRVDGAVANKMGTNLLSILAAHYGRPFYVATETLKLQPTTRSGLPIILEARPPSEVVSEGDLEHDASVDVRNAFFDLTPPSRITMLITEQGVYAPSRISDAWRDLERAFKQVIPGEGR